MANEHKWMCSSQLKAKSSPPTIVQSFSSQPEWKTWRLFVERKTWRLFVERKTWGLFVERKAWRLFVERKTWRLFVERKTWGPFVERKAWRLFVERKAWRLFVERTKNQEPGSLSHQWRRISWENHPAHSRLCTRK